MQHIEDALNTSETVAIVLSADDLPRVYPIHAELQSELLLDSQVFKDSGAGDWLGFYDWLRTKTGELIGVRLWVDEVNIHLSNATHCVNVVADKKCFPFVVYFGDQREFEDEQSCDQDFGSNMLMLGAGKFALTFNSPRPL